MDDFLVSVATFAAASSFWSSVTCQTVGGHVWCSAVLQSSLKHALFEWGRCGLMEAQMHLTVTDMCQTANKLTAYLHLCTVLDEREQRLRRQWFTKPPCYCGWLEARSAGAGAGLPILALHESPSRLSQYRERDGRWWFTGSDGSASTNGAWTCGVSRRIRGQAT